MVIWSQGAFVSAMALSLLHSLWQGAAVGMVAFVLNARLKRATPDVRCGAFSLLLLLLFAVWLGTFCCLYGAQTRPTALAGVPAGPPHLRLLIQAPADTGALPLPDLATIPLLRSIFPALVAGWALGICVLSLRHIGGFLLLNRLSRTGTTPCPPAWEECAARLATRMGVRRKIRLRCSTRIDVPFAFGLFKSSILLPFSALTGLAPEQVEALIAHELAHFARHDILLNLLLLCMETALFYHPVARWLSMQIRAAREQHCDDLAVQAIGDRALYARALFSLEEARTSTPHLALGAKGDTSDMTNTHLIRRIRRVLGVSTPPERRDPWVKGALALGAVTLAAAAFLPVHAYSPQPGKAGQPPAAFGLTTQVSTQDLGTMKFLFDINGAKVELTGTDLTPDTLLKVNGKEGRFGDLTPRQQKQVRQELRMALKNIPFGEIQGLVAKAASGGSGSTSDPAFTTNKFLFYINGDKIELTSTALTPSTLLKVNGKQERFGDLTPQQQQELQTTMKSVPQVDIQSLVAKAMSDGNGGSSVHVFVAKSFAFDINGDRVELTGTDLTPDTLLKVNGKEGRFGDLTPQQQRQLQEAVKNVSATASSISSTTTPQGTTFQLDLNGDKIELHSATLTPDTPVTVNGEQVLFGDLTAQQQQQLQEAVKNVPSVDIQSLAAKAARGANSAPTAQASSSMKFLLDLSGDKIELHSTNLTPDTPVTVNGKEGRFGDLTPRQQKQIREAMKNVSATASATTITPQR